jgi:hypothetical protein
MIIEALDCIVEDETSFVPAKRGELYKDDVLKKYNGIKSVERELKVIKTSIKSEVFFEFSKEVRSLKLDGYSTKLARVEALRSLKSKYPACNYEVSLIAFFDDFGIYPDVIAINASKLHKFRSIVKSNDLTRREVIDLFK